MPVDFPPIFYTATMVKILREQGSSQYAMELAELILRERPDHEEVRQLMAEMKEEARRAFDRFKSGGNKVPEAPSVEAPFDLGGARPTHDDDVTQEYKITDFGDLTDPAFHDPIVELDLPREGTHLTLVENPEPAGPRERKIQKLETLLTRVQEWRKGLDASHQA